MRKGDKVILLVFILFMTSFVVAADYYFQWTCAQDGSCSASVYDNENFAGPPIQAGITLENLGLDESST